MFYYFSGDGGSELYDPLQSMSPNADTEVMSKEDGEVASDTAGEEGIKENNVELTDEPSPHDSPIFPIQNENDAIFADDAQSSNDMQMQEGNDEGQASSNIEQTKDNKVALLSSSATSNDTEKMDESIETVAPMETAESCSSTDKTGRCTEENIAADEQSNLKTTKETPENELKEMVDNNQTKNDNSVASDSNVVAGSNDESTEKPTDSGETTERGDT